MTYHYITGVFDTCVSPPVVVGAVWYEVVRVDGGVGCCRYLC